MNWNIQKHIQKWLFLDKLIFIYTSSMLTAFVKKYCFNKFTFLLLIFLFFFPPFRFFFLVTEGTSLNSHNIPGFCTFVWKIPLRGKHFPYLLKEILKTSEICWQWFWIRIYFLLLLEYISLVNVPSMLTLSRVNVPSMLTFSRVNVSSMLVFSRVNVPSILNSHVSTYLPCLHSHVSTCFPCLHSHLPCVLTCSRANVPCVITWRTLLLLILLILFSMQVKIHQKTSWQVKIIK